MSWKLAGPAGAAKSQIQQIFPCCSVITVMDKDCCSWRVLFALIIQFNPKAEVINIFSIA